MADTIAAAGRGDDWVWIGGVKGYMDGSLGSRTALFYEPYLDDPKTRGMLRNSGRIATRRWIGAADSAGLQVAIHAIGERANGLLLDIYDSVARRARPRDRRFRIEHAQHLRPPDIDRIARTRRHRLHAAVPRASTTAAGRRSGSAPSGSGPPTPSGACSTGARTSAFGSDWTVASIDPILGIYAAVTRRTLDGKHPGGWVPEEKDQRGGGAARLHRRQRVRRLRGGAPGKLVPGYRADLVLLDRDLTAIPPETIDRVTVRNTVVGGRVVFSAP